MRDCQYAARITGEPFQIVHQAFDTGEEYTIVGMLPVMIITAYEESMHLVEEAMKATRYVCQNILICDAWQGFHHVVISDSVTTLRGISCVFCWFECYRLAPCWFPKHWHLLLNVTHSRSRMHLSDFLAV